MLAGIHCLLTYGCTYECDHCFLRCSPRTEGTFSASQVRELLGEARKIGTIETVGFEGGEPFLHYALLLESVRLATEAGFDTAVETNSYWATSVENAMLWLRPLHEAGLSVLEVSDDALHHGEGEETPARRALEAARSLGLITSTIRIRKPALGESTGEGARGAPIYTGGPKLRGRAADELVTGMPVRPWEELVECTQEDLRNPSRVHVDAFGNVHLCQGLSMGNMWETPLSELVAAYDPDAHPICGPLLRGGPAMLAREYGVRHEDMYVDSCHMCTAVSRELLDEFPQYLCPRHVHEAG